MPGRVRESCAGQKLLLPESILADPGGLPAGANHAAPSQPAKCGGRDVFKLNGDCFGLAGELAERGQVV